MLFLTTMRFTGNGFELEYEDAGTNTRAGADSEEARQSRFAAAEKALDGGVPELADAMLPKVLARATLSGRPGLVEKVRDMMAEQRATGVAAALRGMADRPDRASLLPAIDVPILVITGAGDTLIPTSESEAMAREAGGSKLVIIPGAGHLSSLETPDAFNAALREFLGPMGSPETVLN